MTDEFQRGLITGLAMQPLQVTTEHSTPDDVTAQPSEFIRGLAEASVMSNIFLAIGDSTE